MKRIALTIFIIFIALFGVFSNFHTIKAQEISNNGESLDVYFFYSYSCPHCAKEKIFLNSIEDKYPQVNFSRHAIEDSSNHDLLFELTEEHGADRFLGLVPITFVGDEDFFVGFDNKEGIGQDIENSIKKQLGLNGEKNQTEIRIGEETENLTEENQEKEIPEGITNVENKINVPFAGSINPENHSLPALSVLLGLLDGFNVCSLGALVLILGLVIALKSRKKILGLGSVFVITTALIYGLLIVLWYQLFSALSSFVGAITVIVGLLAVFGGIFFLIEFRNYIKYGPKCNTAGNRFVNKLSGKVQKAFRSKSGLLTLTGIIFLFAAAITVIEFPCSAAVPVVFAGILAEQGLSVLSYLTYIGIFVLFYMLDEIIVFLIAVWKMDVWLASPKFVTWATFIEGIILLLLGGYYLLSIL
jgi:thiol-disulfide isomerase/thioredoxin